MRSGRRRPGLPQQRRWVRPWTRARQALPGQPSHRRGVRPRDPADGRRGGAGDWLGSVAAPDGAMPLSFPVMERYPRAEHWSDWTYTPGLNPTAGLAGRLHRMGVIHPWLDRATHWCWARSRVRLRRGRPRPCRGAGVPRPCARPRSGRGRRRTRRRLAGQGGVVPGGPGGPGLRGDAAAPGGVTGQPVAAAVRRHQHRGPPRSPGPRPAARRRLGNHVGTAGGRLHPGMARDRDPPPSTNTARGSWQSHACPPSTPSCS